MHRFFSFWSLQAVKLVYFLCAKFNDIACIVNHHYHVFHLPRQFYSVNKSCWIVFQLHMIPDYVSIVYLVTRWHHLGKINLGQTRLGNTQWVRFFTACIVYITIVCWRFHTYYTGKIFGSLTVTELLWSPRYNRSRNVFSYFAIFILLYSHTFTGYGPDGREAAAVSRPV